MEKELLQRIASEIRAERARAGLTQQDLANQAGLHVNAIAAYEAGKKDMRLSSLEKISKSINYIFTI